jgi:hypothetical protein
MTSYQTDSCKSCRYSASTYLSPGEQVLVCRRFPPQIVTIPQSEFRLFLGQVNVQYPLSLFPQVHGDNTWCGEFERA